MSLKEPPKVAFHKGTEITSSQNLLLGPIQQNDELNLLEQNSTTGNFNYMLVCYKMADSCLHRSSQEINANKITISSATCKMFCLNGKMSLLVGKFNVNRTWKLSLYRLDTDTLHATWRSLSHFSLLVSESMFDFENSIPISHKNDGVVITSALNDRIVFHIFLKALSGKKSWASAFSMLSLPQGCSAKFKIQSCDVLLDHIYCSLLQPGVGARVCQFKIRILQQHQRNSINVRPSNTWHIKDDPTLQNCFISVHNEKVILICCNDANNKSIIEIKYPKSGSTTVSFAQYRFECPYIVKIVSATVVPCSESLVIALIYHDIETKKCYINRIDMSSYSCIQSPSAICI